MGENKEMVKAKEKAVTELLDDLRYWHNATITVLMHEYGIRNEDYTRIQANHIKLKPEVLNDFKTKLIKRLKGSPLFDKLAAQCMDEILTLFKGRWKQTSVYNFSDEGIYIRDTFLHDVEYDDVGVDGLGLNVALNGIETLLPREYRVRYIIMNEVFQAIMEELTVYYYHKCPVRWFDRESETLYPSDVLWGIFVPSSDSLFKWLILFETADSSHFRHYYNTSMKINKIDDLTEKLESSSPTSPSCERNKRGRVEKNGLLSWLFGNGGED